MRQAQIDQAVQQLKELYRRYGYTQYKMSKFEPYDLYVRNKSFLISKDILTFTDADGRLMALKPDVTLSIVKDAKEGAGLQKVYYVENVYRTSAMTQGFQEIMQTGLECVGEIDLVATGEVLLLAAESLALINGDYLLDVGHLGFLAGLLDSAGAPEDSREELLERLAHKNTAALDSLARELGLDPGVSEDLCRLAALYGPPEAVLRPLEKMVRNDRMAGALAELREVCALAEGKRLRLDFSIVNDMDYYNGLIFRGYLPGVPSGVLSGGRYDNLLRQMSRSGCAIGFAVYMNLLELMEDQDAAFDADVLLLYDEKTPAPALFREAERYRRAGESVRVERQAPEGLFFRTVQKVGEGT